MAFGRAVGHNLEAAKQLEKEGISAEVSRLWARNGGQLFWGAMACPLSLFAFLVQTASGWSWACS